MKINLTKIGPGEYRHGDLVVYKSRCNSRTYWVITPVDKSKILAKVRTLADARSFLAAN